MTDPQGKYCPLFSQQKHALCKGQDCAWFLAKPEGSGEPSECALTCLAKQISIIAKR